MKKLFKLLEDTAILSCTFFKLFDNTEWSYFNNDLDKVIHYDNKEWSYFNNHLDKVISYFPYKSDYAIMEIKKLRKPYELPRIEIRLTEAGQLKSKILKIVKNNQDFIIEFGYNLIEINKEIEKINNYKKE